MNQNADKPDAAGDRERAEQREGDAKKTPSSDMQPDDAGTEASAEPDARATAGGTPAESVMKQQSKTDAERNR
ncbi:hypothetical protein WG922_06915 [Ramlibacter sp. AN1015]|uniref:hypothetical protein n=1 Tax=Ramlibacter sp. AN1015 TaxID=3133428 RepID=UPI0030BC210A